MKFAVCVVLLLVTINAASSQRRALDYSKKRSIMDVMLQVESKLKAGSPLDAVLNVLIAFREAVNGEQVSHDEIYNIQQNECASENDFRNKQVTDASNVLRDSSAALTRCQVQKVRVSSQNEVNQQQTFGNEERLNLVLATRESEQGYFKRRSQDYEDALHNIEEALDILDAITSGSRSFIDLSKNSKVLLQSAITLRQTLNFAPVLSALSQLASQERQLDASAFERVAQLLETLRGNIQEAYNEFASSDAEAVAAFNDQVEDLKSNLARLTAQNERMADKLDNLSQCIGTQSAIAESASGKLQRNTQLWDQSKALCATFDNEYTYATTSRRHELQLVTELEAMVEKRFAQVEDQAPQLLPRPQEMDMGAPPRK